MTLFTRLCIYLVIGGCCTTLLQGCALLAPAVKHELIQMKPGQYHLDPRHASLQFEVEHLGLSTFIGRFNQLDARLNFDPNNMAAASLQATVNTASVDTNNTQLDTLLAGRNWFHSEHYPEAIFISHNIVPDGSGFRFDGALTLKGITRPVSLYGKFRGAATNRLNGRYTLGFSAEGSIKRADFGLDSYLALIGDDVTLKIHAEFLRQ